LNTKEFRPISILTLLGPPEPIQNSIKNIYQLSNNKNT